MRAWLAIVMLASCVDGGDWCDLTGHWTGTWTGSDGTSGALDTQLVVSGSNVDGSLAFTGWPCFASGPFAGTLAHTQISGSAGAVAVTARWVDAQLQGTFDAMGCSGGTLVLDKR